MFYSDNREKLKQIDKNRPKRFKNHDTYELYQFLLIHGEVEFSVKAEFQLANNFEGLLFFI